MDCAEQKNSKKIDKSYNPPPPFRKGGENSIKISGEYSINKYYFNFFKKSFKIISRFGLPISVNS